MMTSCRRAAAIFAAAAMIWTAGQAFAAASTPESAFPGSSGLDARAFSSRTVEVDGTRLHYVRGGPAGAPTLVMLPGWPQSWYAFRRVMPALAERYDVIVFDPPGLGDSDLATTGYDTGSIARTMRDAVKRLGVEEGYTLVGHDVGAWISYAYAQAFGDEVGRLVLLDAAIPGVPTPQAFGVDKAANYFQFYFNAVPGLPEELTRGREEMFLRWFFDNKTQVRSAISDEDLEEYLRSYRQPQRMTAGFEYYRAVPTDIRQNTGTVARPLKMPVLALGASKGTGDGLLKAMTAVGSPLVEGGALEGCGHYVAEECPGRLTERLLSFFSSTSARN